MTVNKAALTRVKNQIDKIDNELLCLLKKRFELVQNWHAHYGLKAKALSYMPDREAMIVRSVLEQNEGELPPQTLAKIWREIISSEEQSHTPFAVAIYTKECPREMTEMAKDYFGSVGRYMPCLSISQAIQKIDVGEAGVAILPLFEQSEESWWTTLSSGEHNMLKIVAKLPFGIGEETFRAKEAFVISTVPFNPTGQDRTLFAIEMTSQASIASLRALFEEVGLEVHHVWPAYNLSRIYFFAIELEGYVSMEDARIKAFQKAQEKNILVLRSIGGYAMQEVLK